MGLGGRPPGAWCVGKRSTQVRTTTIDWATAFTSGSMPLNKPGGGPSGATRGRTSPQWSALWSAWAIASTCWIPATPVCSPGPIRISHASSVERSSRSRETQITTSISIVLFSTGSIPCSKQAESTSRVAELSSSRYNKGVDYPACGNEAACSKEPTFSSVYGNLKTSWQSGS